MTNYKKLTKKTQNRTIRSGIFGIAIVILMGVGIGATFGFTNPIPADAQFASEITITSTIPASVPFTPVLVVPALLPVLPPPIIPITLPSIHTEAPAPAVTPASPTPEITVTAPAAETPIQTPPCCTVPNTAVSTPVAIIPATPEITVTAPAAETPIQTPPCCTAPSVPLPATIIPPSAEITVTAPAPEIPIQTPPCCTIPNTPAAPVPVVAPSVPVSIAPPVVVPPFVVPEIPPVIIPPVIVPPVIVPTVPVPQCTLIAGPTTIQVGGNSLLTFTTAQATSFSINNSIGSLTPVASGSIVVIPNTTTTYVGTATGPGGTITCNATVTVVASSTPIPPACVLTASATTINAGDAVTLSYSGTNISSVSIDNAALATTTTTQGTVTVKPTANTTYTGTFTTTAGGTLICTAPVTITTGGGGGGGGTSGGGGGGTSSGGGTTSGGGRSGGGGGYNSPNVTLTTRAFEAPLGAVYLSQIPYTGLDLGPVGTALYWLTLIIWSLAAAYLVFFGAFPLLRRKAVVFASSVKESVNGGDTLLLPEHALATARPIAMPVMHTLAPEPVAVIHQAAHTAAVNAAMPQAASTAQYAESAQAPAYVRQSGNGFKAFATSGALSIDDIVKGLSRESGMVFSTPTQAHAETPVPAPAPVAVSENATVETHEQSKGVTYATRMDEEALPATVTATAPAPAAEKAPSFAAPASVPQALAAPAPVAAEVPGFISAILNGERDQVFMIIRQMNQAGHDVEAFVSHAILALDDAYRGRIDGTPVHEDVKRVTDHLATPFLEKFVTSLTTAIDGSYSMGVTGLKIALTRALAVAQG